MPDIKRYKDTVDSFCQYLLEIHEGITDIKLAEDKWTLKEILGHLIDSASNNHQRFVRLQFGDLLDFPAYEGEEWAKVQSYNSMSWGVLVTLWYHYNALLFHIIESADKTAYQNVWVNDEDAIPLEQLIQEYYKHLELHIEHFHKREEELAG